MIDRSIDRWIHQQADQTSPVCGCDHAGESDPIREHTPQHRQFCPCVGDGCRWMDSSLVLCAGHRFPTMDSPALDTNASRRNPRWVRSGSHAFSLFVVVVVVSARA